MMITIKRIGVFISSLLLIYSCNGNYDFTKPIDGAASFLSGTLVLPIGQTQFLISDIIQSLNISDLKQDDNQVYYVRFDSTTANEMTILPLKIYPVHSKVEIRDFFRVLVLNAGGDPNNLNESLQVPLYMPVAAVIYDQTQTIAYEVDTRIEELHELLLADNTIMEIKCQTQGLYGGKQTGIMELTLDFSETRLIFADGGTRLVYDIVANSATGQVRSKVVTKPLQSLVNTNPKQMGRLSFKATLKTKVSDPAVDPHFTVTEIDPKVILDIAISNANQKIELKAKQIVGRFDVEVAPSVSTLDVENVFESYPEGNLLTKGAKLDIEVANPIDIPLKVDVTIGSHDHNDMPIRTYAHIKQMAIPARYMSSDDIVVHYNEDVVNAMVADRKQMAKLTNTVQGVTDKEPVYLHRIDPNISTYPFAVSYSLYVPFAFKQGGYLQIDQAQKNVPNSQVKEAIKGVESAYIYVDYQNWLPFDLYLTLNALDVQGEQIGILGSDLLIKAGAPNGAGIIDPNVLDPVLGGRAAIDQLEIPLDKEKMQLLQQTVEISYRLTLKPNANVDFAAVSSKAKLHIRLSLKKGRGGFNVDLFGAQP